MNTQTYNEAILELATAGLQALEEFNVTASVKTPTTRSHFICHWMVNALKNKHFPKLVANDLTLWIRQARSQGTSTDLPSILFKIKNQYTLIKDKQQGLGLGLTTFITQLEQEDWIIIKDQSLSPQLKLKLNSHGRSSLIISENDYFHNIQNDELIKPVTLYIRADETILVAKALKHHLLLTLGNKKASFIKHHKAYHVWPSNLAPTLSLLA
ncbi:DUF2913 family protein [Shewanella surugensis]|uniref:DUF2913 family protein n=1 Tax=Shewanella surugensis TaxID=212020 RepID=A0ABT0L822_9GAMM|nr:DUF2913 family protein [Shewanella surugensis]MCL1123800.1 DUF2913 family protein [Shewanella surugensis]